MSTYKKASKIRHHPERHQPESRKHLGLLEKKKDYVARARDYNEKQQAIKTLRKRALNKNPDEFYFHMINSTTSQRGTHKELTKEDQFTDDQKKLMQTQDLNYIAYKRNIEAKKVAKMQSTLHMIDAANETPNKHIFFVDDSTEVKHFDLAQRLDTHPDLIDRRTNRPKLSTLKKIKLPDYDEATLEKIEKQKLQAYKEMDKRIDRETALTVVQQTMEIERALKDRKVTKPKRLKAGSKTSAPIYQWKYERKR
ncbi:hypothetical protein TKK_0011488 [Trichogramma kaykai]|uniref:U3 small nucleolar RNA-associated protein 11 n=1 Tax=Trichogramma kaykai TaxID=54128 RepID=A0ABD2WQT7_9HYME